MINLSKYKEILGKEAKDLSDEEIDKILQAQYQFAELAFEIWANKMGVDSKLHKNQ